jgi:hypothetical protein
MNKAPWQMTRDEYITHYLREAYKNEYGDTEGYELWLKSPLSRKEVQQALMNADDVRLLEIEQALAEGKPIPEEVLQDYTLTQEHKTLQERIQP